MDASSDHNLQIQPHIQIKPASPAKVRTMRATSEQHSLPLYESSHPIGLERKLARHEEVLMSQSICLWR
jgi:hypothetical protein